MAQFIAFDENVEIIGNGLLSVFAGVVATIGEKQATKLFKQHNLFPIEPEEWFPQQSCLNLLRDLDDVADLIAVGVHVFQPSNNPTVKTVADALHFLNVGYQGIHRGGDCGDYQFHLVSNQQGRLICHNPYPADLDFGLIYSLLKYYPTHNEMRIVWDPKIPNRKQGADSCEFLIAW